MRDGFLICELRYGFATARILFNSIKSVEKVLKLPRQSSKFHLQRPHLHFKSATDDFYIRKSQRKTGLSRKSKTTAANAPAK
jgi:hypothetical protein